MLKVYVHSSFSIFAALVKIIDPPLNISPETNNHSTYHDEDLFMCSYIAEWFVDSSICQLLNVMNNLRNGIFSITVNISVCLRLFIISDILVSFAVCIIRPCLYTILHLFFDVMCISLNTYIQ